MKIKLRYVETSAHCDPASPLCMEEVIRIFFRFQESNHDSRDVSSTTRAEVIHVETNMYNVIEKCKLNKQTLSIFEIV